MPDPLAPLALPFADLAHPSASKRAQARASRRASRRAWLVTLSLAGLAALAASPASAGSGDPVTLKLLAPLSATHSPTQPLQGSQIALQRQITALTVERLERRLKAAQVKDFKIESGLGSLITIKAYGAELSASWLMGALAPPGRLGVHALRPVPELWAELAEQAAPGVLLREPEAGDMEEGAYLWSKERAALDRLLSRVSVPRLTLRVAPDKQGWRAVALEPARITEAQVRRVWLRQTPTGLPFGVLELQSLLGLTSDVGQDSRLAIVLDDEVVEFIARPAPSTQAQLQVLCSSVEAIEARRLCVRQIIARLAAPLPAPLAAAP